jgi:hypothetical protein
MRTSKFSVLAALIVAVAGCATQPVGVGPALKARKGEASNWYVLGIPLRWGHGVADAEKDAGIDYAATVDFDFRWYFVVWCTTTTVWGESKDEYWKHAKDLSETILCPSCGTPLESGVKFCKSCGRSRDGVQPASAPK